MSDPGKGPNEPLIGDKRARGKLSTPALVLDLDAFERNLATMQSMIETAGLKLRPHAKTHKSVEISKRQIAAGAVGVCCATLRETRAMVNGGVPGVLLTSPLVAGEKLASLIALNERGDDLIAVADDAGVVDRLDRLAGDSGKAMQLLVDIDMGMGRTGVPDADAAVALARRIEAADHLIYRGIQSYSGMVQHIETLGDRRAVYGNQLDHLRGVLAALDDAGLAPEIRSGGGTGTFAIDEDEKLLSEHQAGSYIFMDVEYNAVDFFGDGRNPYETALFIDSTVISANAGGFVTIEGGYKCFATDGPVPQLHAGAPEGAVYEYFGDEFGRVVFAKPSDSLALGDRVTVTTPHCDPTINLHNYYHVLRGDKLVDIWPVDARGVL